MYVTDNFQYQFDNAIVELAEMEQSYFALCCLVPLYLQDGPLALVST